MTLNLRMAGLDWMLGRTCSEIVKVVRPWNRFPREAVHDSSLEAFKERLDGALSNLI